MTTFIRKGSLVSSHYRSNGSYVKEHYRTSTQVNFESYCKDYDPYSLTKSNLFATHCFDCNAEVYFVRNTTYFGCFLADEIEPNWVIHPCWLDNKNNQEKMESIIKYYKIRRTYLTNINKKAIIIESEKEKIANDLNKKTKEKEANEKNKVDEANKELNHNNNNFISSLDFNPNPDSTPEIIGFTGVLTGHIFNKNIAENKNLTILETYCKDFKFNLYIDENIISQKSSDYNLRIRKRGNINIIYATNNETEMDDFFKNNWIKRMANKID